MDENLRIAIGKRLRFAREHSGIKQKEIASHFEIWDNTVSYWESGQRTPNIEQLIELAKVFNVTTDFLLGVTPREMTNLEKECIACEFLGMNKIQLCSMQAIFTALETHEVINGFVKILGVAAESARKEGQK